jgi:hypothetical protein
METQEKVLNTHDERTLEIKMTVVTALLTTCIFNEAMDSIKDSDFYSGKMKNAGRQFEIQITNKCNAMVDQLWQFDELASSNLTQAIRDIATYIVTLKPSEMLTLSKAMKEGKIQFK